MDCDIVFENGEECCLQELKQCIKENRELDDFWEFFSHRFLLHFVRGKKCDSAKAYVTLVNFINIRRFKYRDLFKTLRPSTNPGLETGAYQMLKNRDLLGCWNPQQVPLHDLINLLIFGLEEVWNFKDAEINGIVVVFELSSFYLQHFMALTIPGMIKAISLLWNNFPLRPQAIHILNEMYLFTLLFRTLKAILPKKITDRLYFHGTKPNSFNTFHHHLSPEILPHFLGGLLSEKEAFDLTFEKKIRDKEDYYERFAFKL